MLPRAVLVAALLASAPAGAGSAGRCAGIADRPWRELRTEHFVLATDLPPDDADDLAEQLEVLRAAVVGGLFAAPPASTRPLPVVAFAAVEDFRSFVPKPLVGAYGRGRSGEVVLLRGDVGRVTRASIVAHELTHAMVAQVLPRPPRWLDEGLATFMEGVGEGERGETVRVGAPLRERVQLARHDRVPVAEVLLATRAPFDERQYATSWLLVHFLMAKRRDGLLAFEGRLARGEDAASAWRAAFPEWDPASASSAATLDQALLTYLRDDGTYEETRFPAHGDGAYRVTELAPAEVRALCAALPAWTDAHR